MRMIKVGDKYLGLVDNRRDAMRFMGGRTDVQAITDQVNTLNTEASPARVVKLKTRADQTGDAMRGLASDVNND